MIWRILTRKDVLQVKIPAINEDSGIPFELACSRRSDSGARAKNKASEVACSRRSDSGARAKNKASERAGKKTRGDSSLPSLLLLVSPRFFSRSFGLPSFYFPLFRSLCFSLALHYLNAWNRLLSNSLFALSNSVIFIMIIQFNFTNEN